MLSIYWAYLKTTLALQFQYRVAMAIWMIGGLLEPMIYCVVWSTVAIARGGDVAGYDAGEFAAYYIVLMVVNMWTFTWIMHEMGYRVQHGELSAMLLKPIHPIHSDIADNIGYKTLTLCVLIPSAAVLCLLFKPTFHFDVVSGLLFALSLILSYLLRFFVEWALSLVAFWTTRTDAVNQMYFFFGLFLSGRIAPLDLLPGWARAIADALPFKWSVAFPVELLLGRLDTAQIERGLLMQLLWVVIGFAIFKLAWRRGVRKYSAVGS
ncbi:MAG: ABC-2 family transporter protein [Gemmatimonadota bacterium]|nr:ABC-2 family transporter protein [Gemmatimonadota bacterium]